MMDSCFPAGNSGGQAATVKQWLLWGRMEVVVVPGAALFSVG